MWNNFFPKITDQIKKFDLRTVPNRPNVHHVRQPKTENTDSIPQLPENGESPLSTKPPQPPTTINERLIAHAAEVKFTNNRYSTPVTIEFGSSNSDNTVNLPVKCRHQTARPFRLHRH